MPDRHVPHASAADDHSAARHEVKDGTALQGAVPEVVVAPATALLPARLKRPPRDLLARQRVLGNRAVARSLEPRPARPAGPEPATLEEDDAVPIPAAVGPAGPAAPVAGRLVQREPAAANHIATLDEYLDRWNTPEEDLITLLGQMDATEKHTVIVGYRDRIASALNFDEMKRALANLGAELAIRLDWLQRASVATVAISYNEIQPLITGAPQQSERDALKNGRWLSFFTTVCNNDTIVQAVTDLRFDLPTQLRWISAEADSRLEMDLAMVERLITAASPEGRAEVSQDSWRPFWTAVCTNATMAQLVDLLFPDNLVKKLEWMADEGAALDKVNEKVTACTDPAQKLAVFNSGVVQSMMVSLCNDVEMINFVLSLGGDWAKWKPWAQAEGAPLNSLAIAAMTANKITEPTLVGFIRVIQSGGSATAARDYIRNLNDADLATLRASGVPQDVITEVWGSDADPVTRALNGEIFTGEQSVTNAETLLTGPTTSPFVAMNFGDDHRFNITYNRDGVDVYVDVKLTPVDDRATELLPSAITTWTTNISNAWNNQFNITNGQRTIPIRFHANLGNSGSNEVNVHSGRWVWPNLNAGNWFVPDPVNQPGQAAAVSTAPVHEFGHLIGNLDEYNISAAHYLTVVGTPAATDPNAVGQTDTAGTTRYTNVNSVMGQGGPALQRHVSNILGYVNSNLRTGEPVFTFAP